YSFVWISKHITLRILFFIWSAMRTFMSVWIKFAFFSDFLSTVIIFSAIFMNRSAFSVTFHLVVIMFHFSRRHFMHPSAMIFFIGFWFFVRKFVFIINLMALTRTHIMRYAFCICI